MQNSYYEILRVKPSATDEDVKHAYKSMAKKFHPDLNPQNRRLAELRFHLISEAYSHLKTREQRARYNQRLRQKAENDNNNKGGFFSTISEIFRPQKRESYDRP